MVQVVVALVAPVGVGQVLIVLGRAGRRLVRVDVPVTHAAVAEAEAHARRHLGQDVTATAVGVGVASLAVDFQGCQ